VNLDSMDLSRLDILRPILPFPLWQKVAALAGGFIVIIGLYLYFVWLPLYEEVQQVRASIDTQQQMLAKNRRLAANLPRKQAEYAQLEKQLHVALKMLPSKSQIPDLLEGVSRAGKESGLVFTVFRPGEEKPGEYVAEVPVEVEITGTYRQLVTFLKRVGEMPRIVDIKNLTLAPVEGGKAPGNTGRTRLNISGLAVTYRFVESAGKKTGADNRKGRR